MEISLTHYVPEVETITKILLNGFAWVPNKRYLIKDLVPIHDFTEREPQQFGMISFTDLSPLQAERHRSVFGKYGIVVTSEWANENKAQKVQYLDHKGPIFDSFKWIFCQGYMDMKNHIRFPDDKAWKMAFTNKAMAGASGGTLWANLLTIYEYLEIQENSYQSEWRIVNPHPIYGYADTKQGIIKNVDPPQGWAQIVHVLKINAKDVSGFVCPDNKKEDFLKNIPEEYLGKEIVTY